MKRVQLHLSDKQIEILKKLAEEAGVSFAEMLRRALDASPVMKKSNRLDGLADGAFPPR